MRLSAEMLSKLRTVLIQKNIHGVYIPYKDSDHNVLTRLHNNNGFIIFLNDDATDIIIDTDPLYTLSSSNFGLYSSILEYNKKSLNGNLGHYLLIGDRFFNPDLR